MRLAKAHLAAAIRIAIAACRKDGITGMSIANLMQITKTRGIQMSVSEYNRSFAEIARRVAKARNFTIIEGDGSEQVPA